MKNIGKIHTAKQTNKTRRLKNIGSEQIQLLMLALPALVVIIIMNYIPMFGVITAFKDYKYNLGIFGSQWIGLKNFEFFFKSRDASVVIRNALLYNLTFIITGQFISVVLAIMLANIRSKRATGIFQNAMFQPFFLSWVVVAYD